MDRKQGQKNCLGDDIKESSRIASELRGDRYMYDQQSENPDIVKGYWSEKVLVVTKDYEIKGYVFMPRTGKKNRVLSDILNGEKRFVAIKEAEVASRQYPERKAEVCDFLHLNLDSIIILKPANLNK